MLVAMVALAWVSGGAALLVSRRGTLAPAGVAPRGTVTWTAPLAAAKKKKKKAPNGGGSGLAVGGGGVVAACSPKAKWLLAMTADDAAALAPGGSCVCDVDGAPRLMVRAPGGAFAALGVACARCQYPMAGGTVVEAADEPTIECSACGETFTLSSGTPCGSRARQRLVRMGLVRGAAEGQVAGVLATCRIRILASI